jgi:hypothetical protein
MATTSKDKSTLGNLPRRAELIQGLLLGWDYKRAAEWLLVECGVSVSGSAWTPFYRRYVAPIHQDRKQFASLEAKALGKLAKEREAFNDAAIFELTEYAYKLMRAPGEDPEAVRKWMETLIKAQAGQRDSRKLTLLEAAAKEAKARLVALTTAAKSNNGLTPETLRQIEEAAGLL